MTVKVRIMRPVGSPVTGAVLQAGALAELPEFWVKRFIADGSAVPAEPEKAQPEPKPKKRK